MAATILILLRKNVRQFALFSLMLLSGTALAQQTVCGNSCRLAAERPFVDENAAAMDRMMAGMNVKPTGNIDRDFVAMMGPHHQGAIDMARAYLQFGQNEQLQRLAQEIIVEQGQEIAAMNLAIGDPLPASTAASTQVGLRPIPATVLSPSPHHHRTINE
jgi:hypothetical protein